MSVSQAHLSKKGLAMKQTFFATLALALAAAFIAFACASPTKTKTVYVPVDDDASPADDDASPAADDDTEGGWNCSELYGIACGTCELEFRNAVGTPLDENGAQAACQGGADGLGLGGCIANCIIEYRENCTAMATCVNACEMPQ
jgi:hypothetical protein